MSKRPSLNLTDLVSRLCAQLAVHGPQPGGVLCRALGISQPSLSRTIQAAGAHVLIAGAARRTQYALRRAIDGLPPALPVYQAASPTKPTRLLLTLHPVAPRGFWCQPEDPKVQGRFFPDLPYFLSDLQPAGFLGRLVPLLHPQDDLPRDVTLWSVNQTLRYLTRYGWDLPGDLIVGDAARARYDAAQTQSPYPTIVAAQRASIYVSMAAEVLSFGIPGSSAGGEQPKFLASVLDGLTLRHVLVKFSPAIAGADPEASAAHIRTADLLVCEHLALQTLQRAGLPSATTGLLRAQGQTFLEVTRFDRVRGARLGVLSLRALDAEFVGHGEGWVEIGEALCGQGVIKRAHLARIRWLAAFGALIGNTDMHCGNLAFLTDGLRVLDLTPTFDMTPMRYAPTRHGQMDSAPLPPVITQAAWPADVLAAAHSFWTQAAQHPWISKAMAEIARQNAAALSS